MYLRLYHVLTVVDNRVLAENVSCENMKTALTFTDQL